MKKLFVLAVFTCLFQSLLFAQIQLGPKAGFNFTNFALSKQGKDEFKTPGITGFSAGAALEIPFSGRFSATIEGLYNQKGGRFESKAAYLLENGNAYFLELEDRINYLDFPVLLKYYLRGKDFGFNLQGGFALGFAMNAQRTRGKFTNANNPRDIIELTKESYNIGDGPLDRYLKTDFGILLGAGMFYELEVGKLVVDARYYFGSSNVYNTSFETEEQRNRGLMLSVGYLFPLGGGW
jgi:hypothetical protein